MIVEYGKRGIIGCIDISSCVNLEPELYAMAPSGVAILTTRISLPETTPEELKKLPEKACEAAAKLAEAKPDLILFACTSGSFINGKGYDQMISRKLQTAAGGIPILTTATAILDALQAVSAKKIAFGSPYIDSVNQRAKTYFEENGYQVVAMNGLGLHTDYEIGLETEDSVRKLVFDVNREAADTIVISCTNLKTAPILDELEIMLGKPVISANQAMLWQALRRIGIEDKIADLGSLMRK